MRHGFWIWVLAAVALSFADRPALAQGPTVPKVRDTNVGYIDPAIPGDVVRLRVDAAYNNPRPTLAEFFWAPGGPFGPGPSIPEKSVSYQDIATYVETLVTETTSVFVEIPVRFLDPELNPNAAGLANMNFGVKHAFIAEEDLVATFQFRTYVPTADVHEGLGNSFVSLEPSLLVYKPLNDRWGLEGELRDWIPIGGTDFAGNIIRYGIGVHYDLYRCDTWKLAPVAEFVGWSILDGQVAVLQPSGPPLAQDATGATIVNAKVGVRFRLGDRMDMYTGYGRPLTGNRWYENVYRFELRFFY